MYARVLDLKGEWSEAEDLARDLVDAAAITQMVALPILGVIEARRGRTTARPALTRAWDMASVAAEDQRLTPIAIAVAEYAWISGDVDLPISDLGKVMTASLERGFTYSPGALAFWLWKLGELPKAPEGIAEPYRLVIEGKADEAAAIWQAKGVAYEKALALMHGDEASQLEAVELFDALGAAAVVGKLRLVMREHGMTVPRGKSRETRRHPAGLTARQSEVLDLLDEGLSNTEIADRLFVSPRTVENHVSAILTKLDVTTRQEAVASARDNDLLPSAAG
jgi:DNA-binding CsgD family transcriptional regulator